MATSASLTDEEMRKMAEDLRTKFIQEQSDVMDPRDLKRLQVDLHHALKFIRHNRGNFNNAFNHMVESYKWRKSFGINDIKYEDIDESLWKSGMALNHGEDREGNPVAILNIHMHRKDSKKALMLQKWIAFCYEMHCRIYPDKKMLMVFDMTGAGLAQMDMDLVRFVVNAFKIYFPNILAYLLVYNMPWVLQAAWKIVQGWLSEGAATRVKFVTNDSIQTYIAPEHLLTKYGGYDQWQYDFEVERDKMLQLINSYHDVADEGEGDDSGNDDDRFTPVVDDEEDGENERRGRGKQMLQKGTTTTTDLRRRQVTRLMSLQEPGKPSSKSTDGRRMINPTMSVDLEQNSSVASLMTEQDHERSANGTPPSLMRKASSSTIGDLSVSPGDELQFSGKKEEESTCMITLTNLSEKTVAYKIKTTAPLRYKVRPNLALIDAKSVAKVKVVLTSGSSSTEIFQDKFLVQTYTFESQSSVPGENRLSAFWKSLPHGSIKELRMRCRRVTSTAGKSVIKPESTSVGGASRGTHPPGKTSGAQVTGTGKKWGGTSGGRSINVEREVARLVEVNNDLCRRMSRLQKFNYLTVLLLLVLIAVVYLY